MTEHLVLVRGFGGSIEDHTDQANVNVGYRRAVEKQREKVTGDDVIEVLLVKVIRKTILATEVTATEEVHELA